MRPNSQFPADLATFIEEILHFLCSAESLEFYWIKRLYDSKYHDWKMIPSFLINTNLGKNFKFHCNLEI